MQPAIFDADYGVYPVTIRYKNPDGTPVPVTVDVDVCSMAEDLAEATDLPPAETPRSRIQESRQTLERLNLVYTGYGFRAFDVPYAAMTTAAGIIKMGADLAKKLDPTLAADEPLASLLPFPGSTSSDAPAPNSEAGNP